MVPFDDVRQALRPNDPRVPRLRACRIIIIISRCTPLPFFTAAALYRRRRFPSEVIGHSAWLYFPFGLSLRQVEEITAVFNVSAGGFIAEVSDAVNPPLKTIAGKLAYLVGGEQVLLDYEPAGLCH